MNDPTPRDCLDCGASTSDRGGTGRAKYCATCKPKRTQALARVAYAQRNAARLEPLTCSCGRPVERRKAFGPRPKRCPECQVVAKKEHRQRHFDRLREDPEKWAEFLCHQRDMLRAWREENAEWAAERDRRWRASNPERAIESKHRRRARFRAGYVAPVSHEAIWQRDGGICQLCREPIDLGLRWPDPGCRTLDHKVPLARGGTHEPDNVQLAHAFCNISKGHRW